MASSILTPVIGNIHFDDLLHTFKLRMTFQLVTPLGDFEREVELTLSDLAAVLTAIPEIWAGVGTVADDPTPTINFVVGDLAAAGAKIALGSPWDENLQSAPGVPTFDPTIVYAGDYDGVADNWGAT